jgi:ferredoxin-NADP reductase
VGNYQVRLRKKEEVAENTVAFYFEKPLGFQFKPGQFANLTLVNPPETDAEGNTRTFSIASAPNETDMMFATRMRAGSINNRSAASELRFGKCAP